MYNCFVLFIYVEFLAYSIYRSKKDEKQNSHKVKLTMPCKKRKTTKITRNRPQIIKQTKIYSSEPNKNRSRFQMLQKVQDILLRLWHPSCWWLKYEASNKSMSVYNRLKRERECRFYNNNISFIICETNIS